MTLLLAYWKYIAGALAVIAVGTALTVWGNGRYQAGVKAERAAWEQEAARLRVIAAEEALQRLQAVNAADAAAVASRVALDALALETRKQADAYYKANPARNVPCLTPDRLRAIAEADTAASKTTAPAK